MELRGSLWSRRRFAVLRGSETAGWLEITPASGGPAALLLSGQHRLALDLPRDVTGPERRLLAAAALVVDRRCS